MPSDWFGDLLHWLRHRLKAGVLLARNFLQKKLKLNHSACSCALQYFTTMCCIYQEWSFMFRLRIELGSIFKKESNKFVVSWTRKLNYSSQFTINWFLILDSLYYTVRSSQNQWCPILSIIYIDIGPIFQKKSRDFIVPFAREKSIIFIWFCHSFNYSFFTVLNCIH